MTRRIVITLALLATPFIVGLLFTYEVLNVEFSSFMENQVSVDYREGPRLLPPEGAVPITGVEAPPDGSLPENPTDAVAASLERGHALFDIHCAVCHGVNGLGDGPVATYFNTSDQASEVADLTADRIQGEEDGLIYLAITKGFQGMPSLAENLTPSERWDVINYLRTVQQAGGSASDQSQG